jgi:murein L,D-transpeptidase YcbB/YkuD
MRGKDVEQLIILLVKQRLLRPDQVPMESVFTQEVEAVVKKFQAAQGLVATGRVDYRTLLILKAQ